MVQQENAVLHISTLATTLMTIRGIIALVGTLVILVGVFLSAYRYCVFRFSTRRAEKAGYTINFIRRDLGLTIVLGLEFIIAADVIQTTTAPDYYSVGILAVVVFIRTFLSWTLSREINLLNTEEKQQLRS